MLLTHDNHSDNLDSQGRAVLHQAPVVVTTASATRRLGKQAQGLAPWSTTFLQSPRRTTIQITATPARHGPPGSRPLVGDVIGFALQWAGQQNGVVWLSGDTVLYRDLREAVQQLDIGVAIVHLGGVRFPITGPLHYTMTAERAVELCSLIEPRLVIPIHYEGWSHFRRKDQQWV
ncbi:beta-lactamase family protein [Streptomyces sp. SLBN-31]|nr:beta-lactamase family protein [Streptomyces sp. SLBN-31]